MSNVFSFEDGKKKSDFKNQKPEKQKEFEIGEEQKKLVISFLRGKENYKFTHKELCKEKCICENSVNKLYENILGSFMLSIFFVLCKKYGAYKGLKVEKCEQCGEVLFIEGECIICFVEKSY